MIRNFFLGFSGLPSAVLALAAWCLWLPPVQAQDDLDKVKVFISYQPTEKPYQERIVLRPNPRVNQPIYFYLLNPTNFLIRNVTVKLARPSPDGPPHLIQEIKVDKLVSKEPYLLQFPKPKDAPKDGVELSGPPFRLQFILEKTDAKGKKIEVERMLYLTIQHPNEYVKATAHFDKQKNQLTAQVETTLDFSGEPCPVELVLSPETIPGLDLSKKDGVFGQELAGPKQKATLIANNITFKDLAPRNARVFLTVDGYARAYTFLTSFDQGNLTPMGLRPPRVRFRLPRFSPPVKEIPTVLEIDGQILEEPLEIGIDRGAGLWKNIDLPGLRQQQVRLDYGPKGLIFKTDVKDWQVPIPSDLLTGKRAVRARIMSEKGPRFLADERDHPLFQKDGQTELAHLEYAKDAVFAHITLDGSNPDGVEFIGLKKEYAPGDLVQVRARARPRTEDQAKINEVKFFLGSSLPKDPDQLFKAQPVPGKEEWFADLALPEKKGPASISVLFTTLTGGKEIKTEKILITSSQNVGKKLAKIKGLVFQGSSSNPRPQPNILVTLKDPKAKDKDKTATSNGEGEFVFENVEPGTYILEAEKKADRTKGKVTLNIPEGKDEVSVKLELAR